MKDRPPFLAATLTLAPCLLVIATSSPAFGETSAWVHAWNDRGLGIEASEVTAVALAKDRPRTVWAGADGALYRSLDGGATWHRLFVARGIGADTALHEEAEESEIDELALRDAAEEIAAEVRESLLDDLIPEYGPELAEEIADDLVESLVEELMQDPELELPDGVDLARLRDRFRADPPDTEGFTRSFDDMQEHGDVVRDDRVFRIDAAAGGRVLVGTSAGLFISFDNGESFEQVSPGLGETGQRVLSARWDPRRRARILAGTGEGLWISEDGGVSFTRAGGVVDRGGVNDIAVHPLTEGIVLAGTESGLLRSDDGGVSFTLVWSPMDEDAAHVTSVDFDPMSGMAYAGTLGGLIVSNDEGLTFARIEPVGLTSRSILDLRVWPGKPKALVVATSSGAFASIDGGESFIEAYPGLPAREVVRVAPVPGEFPGVFAATSVGLFRWERFREGMASLELIERVKRRAPPLSAVAEAALRFSGLDSGWFQAASARANRAWLLPQLIGSIRIVDNRSERHISQQGSPPRRQIDLDDDLRWEVRARWDLDAAIYDARSLAVSSAWSVTRAERARKLDRVAASYSAWLALSVRAEQMSPRDLLEASMLALQIAELAAQLDALTGGFFTGSIESPGSS